MAPSQIVFDEKTKDVTHQTMECAARSDIKVIMVTGGAGFIGSWMTRGLTQMYPEAYHIVCFDSVEECASKNNVKILDDMPNFTFFHGNLRNCEDVERCVEENNVDAIIHFAALSHVDISFSDPYAFAQTNVLGTQNLLEAARKNNIKRFVHISTDEVYGEILPGGRDHIETDALCPTNPYSASKAGAEMLVNAYIKSFHLPASIIRSNNVFGPHQFPEKLIPKFIMLFLENKRVPLYGNGQYTRRYIFAEDVVNAVNVVFHRGKIGEVYNIGTYDEISNRALCTMLISKIKPLTPEGVTSTDLEHYLLPTPDRPFHDRRYGVNFAKLTKLGWEQKVDFATGLQKTIEWYRDNGRNWWPHLEQALGQ